MSVINKRQVLTASSFIFSAFISVGQALAAPAAPVVDQPLSPADQVLAKDVSVMENRFFFHQYGHDPFEKRLERLELLTLGSAQGGTNAERLARLKQAVIERDRASAKAIAQEHVQKSEAEPGAKSSPPILGTLEWRVLKKTYPNESMDQRLGRMETQLFGVPAQAMSYIDRIDRLKKTTGMDIAPTPVAPKIARQMPFNQGGPLPRANRGMQIQIGPGFQANGNNNGNGSKSGYIYDKDGNVTGFYQNNTQSWSWPGNSSAQPNQMGGQNVFEAMDQMNRQMNEMMRHMGAPGLGGFGSLGGFGTFDGSEGMDQPPLITVPQNQAPQGVGPGKAAPRGQSVAPQPKKFTVPKEELPAYTDPNSI